MRRARLSFFVLLATSCQGSDDTSIDSASSSETGASDDGVSVGADSTGNVGDGTTSATTDVDTTCADACTTSSAGSSDATTASGATSTTSSGPESSSGSNEESSTDTGVNLCGNGVVDGDEDCDDAGESAACNANCTTSICGDAIFNATAGEECDAGGESFVCDTDCTLPVCGDNLLNASANELCDEGGETVTCDSDCTPVSCGDGTQNLTALETCDDGDNMSGDGCSANCVIEGDFGGECVVVDGTQWCFDNDNCGQGCSEVCGNLGLVLQPDDMTWFAAQDTPAECQAISDALGMDAPIDFGSYVYGCLEDEGLSDVTGGGLTGALFCSSDPTCPSAHRNDMDSAGIGCDLPDARRSICPCEGIFCGNGVVEAGEICDDGNDIENDGCTSQCSTLPPTCQVVNDQMWCFNNDACGEACEEMCASLGLSLDIADDVWFAAQDSAAECQAISDAFGLVDPIQFSGWFYACLEDSGLNDSVGGGLTGGLYCSSTPECPSQHRLGMDGDGMPCGAGGRRSICPCN